MTEDPYRGLRGLTLFIRDVIKLAVFLLFFLLAPAVGWFIGKRYYVLPDGYEGWSPYGYNMRTGRRSAVVPLEVIILIAFTYVAFASGAQLAGVPALLGIAGLISIWVIVLRRLMLSLDRYAAPKPTRPTARSR